jgi:hypothetical protein
MQPKSADPHGQSLTYGEPYTEGPTVRPSRWHIVRCQILRPAAIRAMQVGKRECCQHPESTNSQLIDFFERGTASAANYRRTVPAHQRVLNFDLA